eukprot:scaffold111002_cov19-Tisochrysis_lutea.AAC.1
MGSRRCSSQAFWNLHIPSISFLSNHFHVDICSFPGTARYSAGYGSGIWATRLCCLLYLSGTAPCPYHALELACPPPFSFMCTAKALGALQDA